MRRKGTGSWEHGTKSWRLRERGIKVSVRQLGKRFACEVPPSEKGSLPFWNRYLAELTPQQRPLIGDTLRIPWELQSILNSVSGIVDPATPPSFRQHLVDELKAKLHPEPTQADSLKTEVESYIARYRQRNRKASYEISSALNPFLGVCRDISFRSITPVHYRSFLAQIDAQPDWSEHTKVNRQRCVHTFLKRLEADYGCVYGFIRNPEYKRQLPEGKKLQYTPEELRTAILNAKGIARTGLLLGLNCGFYYGDIAELKPAHLVENRIVKGRAKNKHKQKPTVGKWKLWPETVAAIQFGLSKLQLERHYTFLREKHHLPEHKALRKTVAQLIQDHVSEEASRLYRCEAVSGTHGSMYIKSFTPVQVAKLDSALDTVHAMIFEFCDSVRLGASHCTSE